MLERDDFDSRVVVFARMPAPNADEAHMLVRYYLDLCSCVSIARLCDEIRLQPALRVVDDCLLDELFRQLTMQTRVDMGVWQIACERWKTRNRDSPNTAIFIATQVRAMSDDEYVQIGMAITGKSRVLEYQGQLVALCLHCLSDRRPSHSNITVFLRSLLEQLGSCEDGMSLDPSIVSLWLSLAFIHPNAGM